jgi:putative dehydrogenase
MMKHQRNPVVGQVGLGIMGGAFSKHLLAAGFDVVGFDIDRSRRTALKRRGGRSADSGAAVAARCRAVITSLPSVKACAAAFFGADGLVAGARRGTVVIETSTLPLSVKLELRARCARRGITVLDTPISGTGAQAAVKDISIYASGERRAFNRCAAIFDGFARATYYCGEFGIGSKLKFIANLLVTIHNVSAAEAMVLGEKAGLDLELLYRVIRDGAGNSRMFDVRGPLMVAGRYQPATMKMDVYQKDIDIIRAFARNLKSPTPLFDASIPIYAAGLRQGRDKQDTAAVFAVLRQRAGLRASAPRRTTRKRK